MSTGGALREAWVVFRKEVRGLARDRHTVIYSVLVPLFLYPGLVWGIVQVLAYARGVEERTASRVLVVDGSRDEALAKLLAGREGLEVLLGAKGSSDSRAAARAKILAGEADAVLAFTPSREGAGGAAWAGSARVYFNSARGASRRARERLEEALAAYRSQVLLDAARSAGAGPEVLDAAPLAARDLSTREDIARTIASHVLPLLMTVVTALGALYPALEVTVGERERGTLETTLAAPVSRSSLVLGKYLAVTAFALLAFAINVASMGLTLLQLGSQLGLDAPPVSPWALLATGTAALLLALLLGAVMMLIGLAARSFKEGQAYVTPVYVLALLPAALASSGGGALTEALALVPVVNVSALFREALLGRLAAAPAAICVISSAAYVAAALLLGARLLRDESLWTGQGLPLPRALALVVPARLRRGGAPRG
ncbi:MAG: ABC transporter permease [Planctomycetes bacterium]|nr:ABC transporter permease [Planctomycetota bacterium]